MKFTIESVTDLKWADNDHTGIACQVKFAEFDNMIPFYATPIDTEEHGRFIFDQAVKGEYGDIADYVFPVSTLPRLPTTFIK
jgi:Tfp pilus assembly protein PilO